MEFFKKSLLNVPYDPKLWVLTVYHTVSIKRPVMNFSQRFNLVLMSLSFYYISMYLWRCHATKVLNLKKKSCENACIGQEDLLGKFAWSMIYCTVSIKRPGLKFFQTCLLNVPYNQKNEGLNILSKGLIIERWEYKHMSYDIYVSM